MNNIILFIVSVSSVTASSIFWKFSAAQILKTSGGGSLLLKQATNPCFIIGWGFYLFATFLWVYLLSKYEYSKIYPLFVGICIILSLITGLIFFKENTGMLYKIIGAALIICGSLFIVNS